EVQRSARAEVPEVQDRACREATVRAGRAVQGDRLVRHRLRGQKGGRGQIRGGEDRVVRQGVLRGEVGLLVVREVEGIGEVVLREERRRQVVKELTLRSCRIA